MAEHRLKTIPPFWCRVARGQKRFELRKHDRDFQVGDTLRLCEWARGEFTGAELIVSVLYLLLPAALGDCGHGRGLYPGWCLMSIGNPDAYSADVRVTSWTGHDCECMGAP